MRRISYALLPLIVLLVLPAGAQAQARQGNPYSLTSIVELVNGGWSNADIVGLVREPGCAFRMTSAAETTLRRAGANAALISGLRPICNRASASSNPTPAQQQRRPPAQGTVLIEGELPPGWTRVVNEIPPNTNRTITLTPGRQAFITVSAPGWCPDRTEVTLRAGEEHRWTPTLRARPWIGGC